MNRFAQLLVAWELLASAMLVRGDEAPLALVATGEPFRGQPVGADAAWKLQFATPQATRELPAADLAKWGAFAEPLPGIEIVLADGGLIVADTARIDKEHLQIDSPSLGKLRLPLELVAGLILHPPFDRASHDQLFARVLAPGGQSDKVLLDNGDELSGTITALGPEGGNPMLRLKTEGGQDETKFDLDRLSAVLFNPTLIDASRPSGLRSLVGLRDGSRVTAVELIADKRKAHLKLPGGVQAQAPTDTIVALQPLGGRVTYLSDLKPASYRHIPFLELTWPYHADRSVLGSQLRAGSHPYLKGLGMHSPARLTYDLDTAYRRFQAEVAVDDESGPRGSVVFRVFTDEGDGWKERGASPIIRGGDPPQPISIDLSGAKRLSLLVDYADRGDELDHADWLDARLVK